MREGQDSVPLWVISLVSKCKRQVYCASKLSKPPRHQMASNFIMP